MLEVLLSDAFTVCFGPSSGPEILIFKRFREKWSTLNNHEPKPRATPLIVAPDDLRSFIQHQLSESHSREDYKELLNLAGIHIGINIDCNIRKPGAIHRARWMAKAIYALKMELLHEGNEAVIKMTAWELQALQRFNRFVVLVYLQSWFTSRCVVDAPVNDIRLIGRLCAFDDKGIQNAGLKMMIRHSWYLSPELATLALFSAKLTSEEKAMLVENVGQDRNAHLLTTLPDSISQLRLSRTFFDVTMIDDSFLSLPPSEWPSTAAYTDAATTVSKLVCVNDCAERGVALEQHRKNFTNCNLNDLSTI
jgi:hypothetical protein